MSYNSDSPANSVAEEIRENFRALKEDKIVAADSATTAASCTGNAATATKLATAVNINGVSFDGSSNITISTGIVPIGSIIMWSGSIDAIPSGWALCNGENSTPDLRDKFVLGAGSSYSVGAIGGEATHTLTIAEMPAHKHSVMEYSGQSGVSGATAYSAHINSNTNGASSDGTTFAGGSEAHNNMPPYYALAYIMRIS